MTADSDRVSRRPVDRLIDFAETWWRYYFGLVIGLFLGYVIGSGR